MRDIYYAGGLTEHYTYDEYNQLTELKTNKISIYTYEYDAEGDRISQKAETKDRFEYGSKYVDTWYDDLSQMDIEEIEDMLQSMDSHTAFDNLRHSIKHRGLCKGNFGQDNVNDVEYGTPSRIENFTSDYLLDKSEEYTQVLADNDKINIYGEERIATNQWSTYNYYITGLNESVYTTTETTSWSEKLTDIEYTDTGLTDDIDKGYAYNGEVKDVSGLIYLRARYYNPRIGQFVQMDSYRGEDENIASQNRYCYTINNPYKYVDPSGNFIITGGLLLAGAIIGGTIAGVAISKSSSKKKKNKDKVQSSSGGGGGGVRSTTSRKNKNTSLNKKKTVKVSYSKKNQKTTKNKVQNTKVQKKQPQPCKYANKLLDELQTVLDILGFVPGLGDICDGINALISYLRGDYISAIISIGCIVFTVFADTLLKPLKWAAKSTKDLAKKIVKKIPNFASKVKGFIKKIPSKLPTWLLDSKAINLVKNGCQRFAGYIDKIFFNVLKKESIQLSKNQITHIIKRHTVDSFAKQASYLPKEILEKKLLNKSFFNPKWSNKKIENAVKYAYDKALRKNTKSVIYSGEKITVVLKGKHLSTAYGSHRYTAEEFLRRFCKKK